MDLTVSNLCFIIILDNNGKRIYSKYFINKDLTTDDKQKDFEKKICNTVVNLNIDRNEEDLFMLNDYLIVSKIYNDTAIFIGAPEDSNEILINKISEAFENMLLKLTEFNITKEKLLKNYDELIILVDEMVYDGLILNINEDKIETNITQTGEVKDSIKSTVGGFASFFGFSFGASRKEERENQASFNGLFSSAKNYLSSSAVNS